MAENRTFLKDLIDPQVMADIISYELPNRIRFAPLARVDNTLVGRAGSTITVPKFKYIGDAVQVAEGAPIPISLLEAASEPYTIQKVAKGAEITDEAVLSGLGDPIGEVSKQLALAIANKVDNDLLAALETATLTSTGATVWGVDAIAAAIDMFADEDDQPMALIMNSADASKLRKSIAGDWDRTGDLGDNILVNGTYGGVLGAQVIRSNKVAAGTAYLVKQGALAIFMKRDVLVETDRDIITKTTVVTADEHYGAYLYDESKAVKITVE